MYILILLLFRSSLVILIPGKGRGRREKQESISGNEREREKRIFLDRLLLGISTQTSMTRDSECKTLTDDEDHRNDDGSWKV